MKKIGTYTTRGRLAASETARITLFDGSFKTAYKVISFKVSPASMTSTEDAFAYLATKEGIGASIGQQWNWSNNVEIAWAVSGGSTGYSFDQHEVIDPDNLIVEDLYITASNIGIVNYMITLEKYDISEWQGALAIVRNNAQNVE